MHKATNKSIHRVYVNVEDSEEVTCDVSTLKNKFGNIKLKYKLLDKDLKNTKEQCNTFKSQNNALKMKESQKVTSFKQEIAKLRKELKRLENAQTLTESLSTRSVSSEDASYDGLGHAKVEVYRSSSFAASQNKGIKRTGSSTVTSANFKRLVSNNQSLLQFTKKMK